MKCFNHADADAVGICKHCMRGLCHACASERSTGLACAGRCESKVDEIGALIDRNLKLTTGAPKMNFIALLVYFGGAAVFAYLGYQDHHPTLRVMLAVIAAIMLLAGLANARVLLTRRARPTI